MVEGLPLAGRAYSKQRELFVGECEPTGEPEICGRRPSLVAGLGELSNATRLRVVLLDWTTLSLVAFDSSRQREYIF